MKLKLQGFSIYCFFCLVFFSNSVKVVEKVFESLEDDEFEDIVERQNHAPFVTQQYPFTSPINSFTPVAQSVVPYMYSVYFSPQMPSPYKNIENHMPLSGSFQSPMVYTSLNTYPMMDYSTIESQPVQTMLSEPPHMSTTEPSMFPLPNTYVQGSPKTSQKIYKQQYAVNDKVELANSDPTLKSLMSNSTPVTRSKFLRVINNKGNSGKGESKRSTHKRAKK